jgi:hypothetical protein
VATTTRTSTADRLVAADALDFALFQHAQQLGLHGQRHVADFVEKYCAVIGLLELSDVPACRPGERSLLVPEEFRLDQLRRNRRAVQGHKCPTGSRAALVDRPRHKLFPGARFSQNADPRLARRDAIELRHNTLHGCALPNDFVLAQALLELAVLALKALQLQRILDR